MSKLEYWREVIDLAEREMDETFPDALKKRLSRGAARISSKPEHDPRKLTPHKRAREFIVTKLDEHIRSRAKH